MSYTPSDYSTCPGFLRDYLYYMLTIKGRSKLTVEGYFIDLRTFFRFLKKYKGLVPEETPLDEISIQDVPLSLAAEVTLSDVYEFLNYTFTEKSNNARTRARKVSALRGLYKYLTNNVGLIPTNPIEKLELPTAKQALPTYLNLEQCYDLLRTFDQADPNHPRDYCIVTLFLNCGMRLSEMSGLNVNSFRDNTLRVLGKGNKERLVYFDARTKIHLQNYLEGRTDENPALFVSLKAPFDRLMIGGVETRLRELGKRLNIPKVHPHKFRRTLATTAIDKGMPIEQVQQLLGHQKIDTTMHYAMVKQQNVKLAHRKYIG